VDEAVDLIESLIERLRSGGDDVRSKSTLILGGA
jgi:hypothetical protein